jgi:hypothetical protein
LPWYCGSGSFGKFARLFPFIGSINIVLHYSNNLTQNCEADVMVAEPQTFIYASRSEGLAQARILRIKDAVPLAALSSSDTAKVLKTNLSYTGQLLPV